MVWDIGAGSGSVSIEGGAACPAGNDVRHRDGRRRPPAHRRQRRAVRRQEHRRRAGPAPDAWADLPDPDAVFVGGSGREIGRLVELAYRAAEAAAGGWWPTWAASKTWPRSTRSCIGTRRDVKVWMINVARGTYQLERVRFEALNPTFLLAANKPR